MIVTTWDKTETYRPFVEQGGNLLVVPALDATGAPRALDWLGTTAGKLETQPKGVPVMLFRVNSGIFADLRDEQGQVAQHGMKAFKFLPLRPANDQDTLFGLDDGRALLVEHKLGKGTVFTSGLAFDPSWTTFPLKSSFLAIAQGMALMRADIDNTLSFVAGERLPNTGNLPAEIKSLIGSPLDWRGDTGHLPVFPRAGIYTFKTGAETRYVAVRCSAKEGVPRFVTGNQVPLLAGITHTIRDFTNLESFLKQVRRVSRGLDLFLPLLLLAILMLLLEAWLANPIQRKT